MHLTLDLPAVPARRSKSLTAPERRTLGAVLAFLGGLAFLGPVAALAAATIAWAGARLVDSR